MREAVSGGMLMDASLLAIGGPVQVKGTLEGGPITAKHTTTHTVQAGAHQHSLRGAGVQHDRQS